MIILSVRGEVVDLAYHPSDGAVEVGDTYTLLDLPDRTEGVVVQVIECQSMDHDGVKGEAIQRILEQHLDSRVIYDRERGMSVIQGIKIARAKIRREVRGSEWREWTGLIPSRHAAVQPVGTGALLARVLPRPRVHLTPFLTAGGVPITVGAENYDKITVLAAAKGRGKSHYMKLLLHRFAERGVGGIVMDLNGEYAGLPGAHVLRWGQDFFPRLRQTGPGMLLSVIRDLCPAVPGSPTESFLDTHLASLFAARRKEGGEVTLAWLRAQSWAGAGDLVEKAIQSRLRQIDSRSLFWGDHAPPDAHTDLWALYEETLKGRPLVVDLSLLDARQQATLVNALIDHLEAVCRHERRTGRGAYPLCVFEEAHEYLSERAVGGIVGRCRHLGLTQFYVSLNPAGIPAVVLRAADNLVLMGLSHADDVRALGRMSLLDAESLESLALRVPVRHALMTGKVTGGYPILAAVDDLPVGVPRSGVTRSTWDRFEA